MPEPEDLAAQLRDMISDLDGYITRRAHEIAAPVIAEAEQDARILVMEAEAETQRWKDCNDELGRRLAAAYRRERREADA